jgi:hypothetical protein
MTSTAESKKLRGRGRGKTPSKKELLVRLEQLEAVPSSPIVPDQSKVKFQWDDMKIHALLDLLLRSFASAFGGSKFNMQLVRHGDGDRQPDREHSRLTFILGVACRIYG